MTERAARNAPDAPIAVYEAHLGSWMRVPDAGGWLTYRDLAGRLADHVADLGFTHVELLPVAEYPLDESWGYGTLGYFAPTSRYGTPQEFMALVDTLHRRGIGVIVDWSAAHFPKDAHGLARFDGTCLYEHEDPRQGEHPHWGSLIFNYGRREVANFLISSALFWFEKYHVDGLRVDAVASMLYLDYGREAGEWVSNAHGGNENLEAVDFLRRLNERVHAEHPGVMMVAEESTAWPLVTGPADAGGLGFDFKWNMGWMNRHVALHGARPGPPAATTMTRSPSASSTPSASTSFCRCRTTRSCTARARCSRACRATSGGGTPICGCSTASWSATPASSSSFMGGEFGQEREWTHAESLDWHLLDRPLHAGLRAWVRDLHRFHRTAPALYELDAEPAGFEWIACDDRATSVLSFLRRGRGGPPIVVVCNFTPVVRRDYRVGVPEGGPWRERLNSDAAGYGGGDLGNAGCVVAAEEPAHGHPFSLRLTLPPLGVLFLMQD